MYLVENVSTRFFKINKTRVRLFFHNGLPTVGGVA